MQRIVEALIRFRNPISYLILLGLSIVFLNGRSNFHQNHLEKYSLYFSQNIYSFSHRIENYFNLKKINERLLKENKILKDLQLKSNELKLYPSNQKLKKRFHSKS